MEKTTDVDAQVESAQGAQNSATKNVPEMKFRAGAVTATIWQNQGLREGEVTTFNTISLERSYKDKKDEWQNTSSMRINDLPRAKLVLGKAYEYLVLNQQNKINA